VPSFDHQQSLFAHHVSGNQRYQKQGQISNVNVVIDQSSDHICDWGQLKSSFRFTEVPDNLPSDFSIANSILAIINDQSAMQSLQYYEDLRQMLEKKFDGVNLLSRQSYIYEIFDLLS